MGYLMTSAMYPPVLHEGVHTDSILPLRLFHRHHHDSYSGYIARVSRIIEISRESLTLSPECLSYLTTLCALSCLDTMSTMVGTQTPPLHLKWRENHFSLEPSIWKFQPFLY